jgi:hypothetical protein
LFASLNKAKIYVKVKPEFSVDDVMKKVRQDMIERGLFKKFEAIGAEVVFQRRTTTFERILQSAESDIAIKIVSKQVGVTSLDSAILVARKVAEKIKNIGGVSDIRIIPEPGNP